MGQQGTQQAATLAEVRRAVEGCAEIPEAIKAGVLALLGTVKPASSPDA